MTKLDPYKESLRQRAALNALSKNTNDELEIDELDNKKLMRTARAVVSKWRGKGVNNFNEFFKYINNPGCIDAKYLILSWKERVPYYQKIWKMYEDDMKLFRIGKRKCLDCGKTLDFKFFTMSMGEIKSYCCRECLKKNKNFKSKKGGLK